jgi:hypothetical protein
MTNIEVFNYIADYLEEIDREDLIKKLQRVDTAKRREIAQMIQEYQHPDLIEVEILVCFINADLLPKKHPSLEWLNAEAADQDGSNERYSVELEHNDVY